jgi:hypothetical protein
MLVLAILLHKLTSTQWTNLMSNHLDAHHRKAKALTIALAKTFWWCTTKPTLVSLASQLSKTAGVLD